MMFSNWLTPTITTNALPPDVILEIGPPPFARYAAHSALLVAHSGYLRSAIRPDERHIDSPIYLPNITTEQFAPLLTYMYTGFLDLNMDNIFGVLLATHILHMPRALEICRAFLTRTQPDGYFAHSFFANTMFEKSSIESGVKVIRPIASKATGLSLGFVAPPQTNKLFPSHDTPFKSLNLASIGEQENARHTRATSPPPLAPPKPSTSKSPPSSEKKPEILIVSKPMPSTQRAYKRGHSDKSKVKSMRNSIETTDKVSAPDSSANDDFNKVIIDVASCDGPIRFQRVLNDAYGRIGRIATTTRVTERSNENVANSFHVQMARTISERQAISATTESENSQDIIVHDQPEPASPETTTSTTTPATITNSSALVANTKSEEVYSCVYCKHTFKSQYCYQKHAKRHINPLSIDGELVVETIDIDPNQKDERGSKIMKASKREVRPLDMNVQYYPCKTCGSKFPSYYFVHKHRKMCHANEDN